MLAFLALGSLWFVAECVVFFHVATVCLGFEKNWVPNLLLVLTGATIYFANPGLDLSPAEHLPLLIAGVVGYLVAGVLWSFAKWAMLVKDAWRARQHLEEAAPQDEGKSFDQWFEDKQHRHPAARRPVAKENKSRIATWFAWWPISLLNFLVFDALRRLGRYIVEKLNAVYERITDSLYPQTPVQPK